MSAETHPTYPFSEERLSDFIVAVSNTENPANSDVLDTFSRCGQFSGQPGDVETMSCAPDATGRYLYVYLPTTQFLAICELEAYGIRMCLLCCYFFNLQNIDTVLRLAHAY